YYDQLRKAHSRRSFVSINPPYMVPEACSYHEDQDPNWKRHPRLLSWCKDLYVNPAEKSMASGLLTEYYIKAANRIYYLFELYGVEQIYHTKHISVPMVTQLKLSELNRLINILPMECALVEMKDLYYNPWENTYSPITETADMEPLVKKKVEEVEVFVVGLLEDLDEKEHDNPDNENPPHEEKFQPNTVPEYHQKTAEIGRNNGKS
ncbi:7427_t:CDS:2, partial [Racocetra persica]